MKLAAIQSNLEEARGGREDGIPSKIRQQSDKLQRTMSADQTKMSLLSEQITKLRESLHSDRVATELLTERMQKDLKLVESSTELDMNALRQARTESHAKLEKALTNTVSEITEVAGPVWVGEAVLTERQGRAASEDRMLKKLEEICGRMEADMAEERHQREEAEDKLIVLLENTCSRVEASLGQSGTQLVSGDDDSW
ncbi:conserved hypothetical protein [Perkinsus marinus ATCC 50983]|uniref:Uncharacterized protein n=1 Tax=Perkinsus marinus (strain ATCC 50983 / TXsc) TaxID=423536 RepID=C5LSJ9_PERM5|nr:conserved hypothetical protein [Perkinsus marinus ATCC 50983]EER00240.1 conserved hypothetical protein [Perkinsus marinus ATCC 50983]|eukprot:XP_002767522.1 conserved hypothetical protein [Perkinsus marinus ATCC 50983]